MNKFAAEGLAQKARSGQRVLIVTEIQAEAQHALNLFEEHVTGISQTIRSQGRQEVQFESGGRITIRSYRSQSYRGLAVDTVFLDAGVDQLISMDDKLTLMACTAASPTGELIRA